jgi:Asp-tRNA(Asn)/Glu-tRNA(Gln) amidotransferase A subunit family amidase
VTAAEVVTAHLDRIAAVNPRINALVQVAGDAALKAAFEADVQVARGNPLGPLHGVPFTVKDVIDVAGIVGAAGAKRPPSPRVSRRSAWATTREAVSASRRTSAALRR